jgi:sortase A
LILLTLYGFFSTFGPAIYYEASYRIQNLAGVRYQVVDTGNNESELGKILARQREQVGENGSLLRAIISNNKEQVLIPSSTDFSIVIPKIGANAKVLPNIDSTNEKEYLSALLKGVAHAKGTAFPGLNGNVYLFAHSADNFWSAGRYNAVFYLLKELEAGDDVSVFFLDKRFNYVVYDKQVVDPEEVSHIQPNLGRGEKLILQTCWPPGTTWKRLLVFAKPK